MAALSGRRSISRNEFLEFSIIHRQWIALFVNANSVRMHFLNRKVGHRRPIASASRCKHTISFINARIEFYDLSLARTNGERALFSLAQSPNACTSVGEPHSHIAIFFQYTANVRLWSNVEMRCSRTHTRASRSTFSYFSIREIFVLQTNTITQCRRI